MKILIVSQYYNPEQFVINEIAPALIECGHDVTVLTGLPNYPEGKVPAEYRCGRRRNEIINNVKVKRSFLFGRKTGAINLAMNYISFMISASVKAIFDRNKYDLVFCYQLSPITMAIPAIIYKKKLHIPLVLYCLDLWPESVQIYLKNKQGYAFKMVDKLSRYVYKQSDKIAITSPSFEKYLTEKHGIESKNITLMYQHADSSLSERKMDKQRGAVVDFMYAGNVGKVQGVDIIIKAVALLKERNDFMVHIVGEGSHLDELKLLTTQLGVEEKVSFHGRHPFTEMPNIYNKADALLLTLSHDCNVGNTIPAKLQSYMSTGKTILGAISGDAMALIKHVGCGECVEAGNAEGLARSMARFIDQPNDFADSGTKGKEYFNRNFTKDIYVNKLQNVIYECCNQLKL